MNTPNCHAHCPDPSETEQELAALRERVEFLQRSVYIVEQLLNVGGPAHDSHRHQWTEIEGDANAWLKEAKCPTA